MQDIREANTMIPAENKPSLTPEEIERLKQHLKSLPRDDSGLSPLLVELSDVLPPEVFSPEDLN